MNWYLKVLKEYGNFEGRARRKEYWMFTLFNFIIQILLTCILVLFSVLFKSPLIFGLFIIYNLFIILPTIAVMVRRLHDTNHSGWYYFVTLIPLVGAIWFLILMCQEGDIGRNAFGEDPKGMPSKTFESAFIDEN